MRTVLFHTKGGREQTGLVPTLSTAIYTGLNPGISSKKPHIIDCQIPCICGGKFTCAHTLKIVSCLPDQPAPWNFLSQLFHKREVSNFLETTSRSFRHFGFYSLLNYTKDFILRKFCKPDNVTSVCDILRTFLQPAALHSREDGLKFKLENIKSNILRAKIHDNQ
jgi:hypothetical protein